MVTPIILCGGSGSRLWPLSRSSHAKQFLKLYNNHTLFQNTILLAAKLPGASNPIVVCNKEHRFMVEEQLKELNITPTGIILEPESKNTAPAITLAVLHAQTQHNTVNDTFLVLPSDHLVKNTDLFIESISKAAINTNDHLTIFGIAPRGPETGYGYIKAGEKYGKDGAHKVARFREKPSIESATSYLAEGDYYWNSGMFMFTSTAVIDELKACSPEVLGACRNAYDHALMEGNIVKVDSACFKECSSISFDYAVMEKTKKACVFPVSFDWSDLGSWNVLWEVGEKDADNNVILGDVVAIETKNSYVRSESRLLTTIGIENLIVIETADAVLVSNRNYVQEVKTLVNALADQSRGEIDHHQRVYRPWGYYKIIDQAEGFQVKHICVNPGQKLSLQMHFHRSEHWSVVYGTARVTNGDKISLLCENESTYIPLGATHRLENPGKMQLHLIEVQVGSYLGEDDIVRFEDDYNRVSKHEEGEINFSKR